MEKDPFAGMEEVRANWIKFNVVGDFVKGTLLSARQIPNRLPGKEGTMTTVYELRAHLGQFHNADENKQVITPPVVLKANDFWIVSGKESIDNQMRNVKPGTIIGFRLTEIKPSKTKGFNAQKVIKVLVGGQDPEYMGESAGDATAQ